MRASVEPTLGRRAEPCQEMPALGQFASPDPLSPRLAAEPLSSNCHVASARAALNEARSRSPGYPYPLASPTAAARPTSHTPRAARALAPRLGRHLFQCRGADDGGGG